MCKILKNGSFYPYAFICKQVFFASLCNTKFIEPEEWAVHAVWPQLYIEDAE